MLQLPVLERNLFIAVLVIHLFCSIMAVVQLVRPAGWLRVVIISLMGVGFCLIAAVMGLRAEKIQAIPLMSLFDSMIVISMALQAVFIYLCFKLRQVWFSSAMVWFISGLVVLSVFAASPAEKNEFLAETPGYIWHGLTMALSGAAIVFSASIAGMFLLARRNLKNKKLARVIGKAPNIEKLEKLNIYGLVSAFIFLTLGILSGAGLAILKRDQVSITFIDWITDSKMILVIAAWLLLVVILVTRRFLFRERAIAHITLIACFFMIFSFIGVNMFCDSEHDFTKTGSKIVKTGGQR